ncbi:bifunctional protein-serine/threonine kinase/phosphatase [Hahella sp. SMD15-11]|uniref:Bifunctional protein-serine/threonine kinase/phosphatase n=1 Tax=Thermohahella caldifontis TaxID=3142973 RepID=A0AB39US29_9GAMM
MSDLRVIAGQRSLAGHKTGNEDSLALCIPESPVIRRKGVVAVVADGVSASECGGEAAEVAVRTFVQDYYATPDTWRVKTSLARVVTALNRWLHGQSLRTLGEARGYVCTFSGVILKPGSLHVFHAGDSRVWRWRDGTLRCLTQDHHLALGKDSGYLTRALGMDSSLELDYRHHSLRAGDVLALTTDGVHGFLPLQTWQRILEDAARAGSGEALEALADKTLELALNAGSDDNLTVQFIRVLDAGEAALTEIPGAGQVRFPPLLAPGDVLDGLTVEAELHASERGQVYRVRDASGNVCVMKTPSPRYADDAAYISRFLLEDWAGRRVDSPHVVQVLPRPESPWLYYLSEWVEGVTLEQWMTAHPAPDIPAVVAIVEQLVRAVRAFHRRDMLHGDLKPANVMIRPDGQVKLIDFGSVWIGGMREEERRPHEGMPLGSSRYSAPEYRQGAAPTLRSELFALAVMAYEMLTGAHPYGEAWEDAVSPVSLGRLRYVPAWSHNPLVPPWFDAALAKALRLDPGQRYGALSDWLTDLKTPNRTLVPDAPRPLAARYPERTWQVISAVLLLLWLGTLAAWLS